MKCLVTGGAGFIGSHLCDALIAAGHEVVAVDNELTGSIRNITHLLSNPNFAYVKHDCSTPLPISIKADVILHFASPASPPKYQKYPIETLLVNSYGTHLLLKKAQDWSAKFIFASSSEIYGDPQVHPQSESYWGNVNSVGPRACYDEAKRVGESWVSTYAHNFNVDTTTIRIFNTYGPRMDIDDGRVVTNFVHQILGNEPLIIYGKGTQTRSFCYVSDLVDGIMTIIQTNLKTGTILNLGNPDEYTIKDFADKISQLAGFTKGYKYVDLPEDDPQRRKPDIALAKSLLGWNPKISLEVGFKKTLEYFKTQMQ